MATVKTNSTKRNSAPANRVAMSGGALVAQAMRQIDPDVVAAYPITPQTIITEAFSEFVANGEVQSEFVRVESEHAAMSACIGASAAGARAQTATSGPGLALMWEVLHVASGNRLPIVMHLCTRALSAPINILCDHSDAMGMRDASWIMLFAENGQEAYDNAIQSVLIAEAPSVELPIASAMDGFFTTHAVEPAELLSDEAVRKFVGEYKPARWLLDPEHNVTIGDIDFHDYYYEHKRQQSDAMKSALSVIEKVGKEYGDLTGRYYGLLEPYRMEDARYAVVAMGSSVGTLRGMVDQMREDGMKAGLIKVRSYRPFPSQKFIELLSSVEKVAVLDRALSFGAPGNPLFADICSVLAGSGLPIKATGWVYGLGGRNTSPAQFQRVFNDMLQDREPEAGEVRYLGLRE